MSGFSLEYGKELSTGISYGEQKMIDPGEEADIVRSQKHYERDSLGILQRTGMADFTKVILVTGQAILADGTRWMTWKPEMAR